MEFEPIGYFKGAGRQTHTAPRQGVLNPGNPGVVELEPGHDFERALRDLGGFERIWLLFHFHQNTDWQPLARPPFLPPEMSPVGLFATRSPYRPNPIGMTCVRLVKIDGLRLVVDEVDLIDGTPVLDIKPYLPRIDSFPDVACGWVDQHMLAERHQS